MPDFWQSFHICSFFSLVNWPYSRISLFFDEQFDILQGKFWFLWNYWSLYNYENYSVFILAWKSCVYVAISPLKLESSCHAAYQVAAVWKRLKLILSWYIAGVSLEYGEEKDNLQTLGVVMPGRWCNLVLQAGKGDVIIQDMVCMAQLFLC